MNYFLPVVIVALFFSCSGQEKNVVIENKLLRYEIDSQGKNLHFTDKVSGKDYLDKTVGSSCASISFGGKEYKVNSINIEGNHLFLKFDSTGLEAGLSIKKEKEYIFLEVFKVPAGTESFTFLNVPLSLTGRFDASFAACALSMNLHTHVLQLPALQTHLKATCYHRTGIVNAKIALIAARPERMLEIIRNVTEAESNFYYSKKGGAWATTYPGNFGSYLMTGGGRLTEKTVDDWIEVCKSLGFNQLDAGGSSYKLGSFEPYPDKFPDGWESFRRINSRLHDSGISPILHTYSFLIDKDSKYVTPEPNEELGYFNEFTLADDIGKGDIEIIVKENTSSISSITGYWVRNSVTLRIGSELIEFTAATDNPPFRFTGCRRGVHGTRKSEHKAGERVFHLMEMFGRFVPGGETSLFDTIAGKIASIVNQCDFDGIYFDAIDASDLFAGEEFYWYYGPKFVVSVAEKLKMPVMMEMAGMTHNWWRFRSKWQAWDTPNRGYKRFVDIHLASIKSHTYKHGEFMGHSPVIDELAGQENSPLLLPLQLGWWRNQVWNPSPQVEMTFPDDIEYLCCKMIGNNAGLSGFSSADKKAIESYPLHLRLHAIIKQYEELRHAGYFSEEIRALLRQPGKEFTLTTGPDGPKLKPVIITKHKVAGNNHESSRWMADNNFKEQPVKLRIQVLMSATSYADPSNVILTDFSGNDELAMREHADGVEGAAFFTTEKREGLSVIELSAFSSGTSPREGSWIKFEKQFSPALNLESNQALGIWINGDGNGELLNFRTGNPIQVGYAGVRGDHFVRVDFKGWKYFELVEIESSEFSHYTWDNVVATRQITEGFNVYNSYRGQVDYKNVDKLQIWYNNLPPGKKINCKISAVKALQMIPVTIVNPSITIDGEEILFPVEMKSGMYLELNSKEDCKLFGSKGELIREVKIDGTVPVLKPGSNKFAFKSQGNNMLNSRVMITLTTQGDPLK